MSPFASATSPFCDRCGAPLLPGNRFCTQCGKRKV
ncbi:MAG: zinc-ribbon domain-containing protein [Promethearchaeota archaeon]